MEGPYHPLRVARVVRETDDARSLVLEIPPALRERFAYRAGQFLTFRVPVEGRRLVRCYSLASSPDTDAEHKVTVKRIAGGRVSSWMHAHVREGDALEVMRPAGRFCLTGRDAPVVLFAAGSGITPVISLVKTALATTRRPVRLVYANRDPASIIFRDELDALAAASDRFTLVHRLDSEQGFLDAEAARAHAELASDADFYVCGPTPFMDAVEAGLGELGVEGPRVFIERFEYADDGAPAAAATPAPEPGAGASTVTITLDGETHEIAWAPGQTIVEAARAGGLDPPTACEEGYCACCMARLESGSGSMKANDVLGPRETAEGWVLTCQFVPSGGPVKVRYPD